MDTAFSQYKTVAPLIQAGPSDAWMSDEDKVRIASYIKYDEIYWGEDQAFRLMRRGPEQQPLYIPTPRTIVDATSHFLLKGLQITSTGEASKLLTEFLKREKFFSRFHTAKHTGVNHGDWIFHLTADPDQDEGERVSLTSVSPASYFPVYDDDDLDKVVKVHLATAFRDPADNKVALQRLTYERVRIDGKKRIGVEENVYHLDVLWTGAEPPLKRVVQEPRLLPEEVTAIPVYHFKNADWQGQPFGSSELRGYERLAAGINQTVSDEELALALEGLGVYATDSGKPEDEDGNEVDWEIGPGRVMETPPGAYFKRVEGVGSVSPMLDHANFVQESMYEASGTFRAGSVDVQVAQSGIALAIRFLPMAAKLEERDLQGIDILQNLWHDWTFWQDAYENTSIGGTEVDVTIGDKLPIDREKRIMELNNMLDRKVISGEFYRQEMEKYGYKFPDNMMEKIVEEQQTWFQFKSNIDTGQGGEGGNAGDPSRPNDRTIPKQNGSNNGARPNESAGTEGNHSSNQAAQRGSAAARGRR